MTTAHAQCGFQKDCRFSFRGKDCTVDKDINTHSRTGYSYDINT